MEKYNISSALLKNKINNPHFVSFGSRPKKIHHLILFLTIIIFNFLPLGEGRWGCLYSQPVTQEWVRTYGYIDSLNDFLNDMVIDTNGNVIVTGRIATNTQNTNYATVKYSSSGQQQWAAIYNGIGTNSIDEAVAVTVDKSGNVYVTGFSEHSGFLTDDYVTIKYNSSGVQQWLARYDSGSLDDPVAIAVDNIGNVYVSGYSYITGADYLTIKYNNNGDSIWTRRYNGPANGNDFARSMVFDRLGNVYVTGNSQSENCYTTIKYSETGQELWVKKFVLGYARGLKIAIDTNFNVFVTGNVWQNNKDDIVTLKYNSTGSLIWYARYGGLSNGNNDVSDIKIDYSQNIYVTGMTNDGGIYGFDYVLIKYNQNGDSLWVRKYLNPNNYTNDRPNSIAVDNNGVYITGYAADSNDNLDATTLKYSHSGNLLWITRQPGGGKKIVVDKNNKVLVSGTIGTNVDFITIKYNQPSGIISSSNGIPEQFSLSQNYPNPFNPKTHIEFAIPPSKGVRGMTAKIVIYDVLGREIAVLVNQQLTPGTYEVEWDGSNYPTGVYFYRLTVFSSAHSKWSDEWSQTRKMVLLK